MLFVVVLGLFFLSASITKAEQVPRCHELVTANGDVTYIGNRERHTHAHITCDEGYSVGKDGVETVQCLQSLQWESTLHCYKRCFQKDLKLSRYSRVIIRPKRKYVEHGQSVHLSCKHGYEHSLASDPDVVCSSGKLNGTIPNCTPKPCDTPIIQNGRLRVGLSNRNYSRATIVSGQMVSVSCEDNFFLYDNRKNEFIKERSFFIKCTLGKIKTIPSCRKESCELPDDPYASYYVNGERYTGNTITHEGNVRVVCEEGTSITVSSDVRTCWNGAWKSGMEFPVCEPGCAIPDISNANITRTNGKHTDKLKNGENITVTCHEGYSVQNSEVDEYYSYRDYFDLETNGTHFTLTCTNGTIGNKKCELSQDSKDQQRTMDPTMKPSSSVYETKSVPSAQTTSPIHKDHGALNCTIPESTAVHFVTLSGDELNVGRQIPNGKVFIAEKECKDYYEGYYLNYDDVDGEEISPPIRPINKVVNCTDGVLSDYTLVCDYVDTSKTAVTTPEGCKTVPNGKVTDNGQSVDCNVGYVNANCLWYERYSCSCDRNIRALVCNGRQAKCKPANCKLDSPIEQGMTLIHKGRFVSSSSIEAIDHGESVVFNCEIGRNDITFEPRHRLFKCDRGKWLEHNRRGGSWSLGNNGMFPKCRPAKCECQNGGTCIRDEMCKCPPFSTGQQCETSLCPDGCQNGGTCTSPNRCSCLERFSGNRCQTGVLDCTIPESTDVHFVTLSGGELKEGTQIHHGKHFIAEKECKDYYKDYYLNYEDADGEVTSPPVNLVNTHVNCTDGVISNYTLVCDDADTSDTAVIISEECKTVPNGNVTDNGQSVECNEGYVNANSLSYERYSCYCDRNIPALVCNGRQAKCKPVNCKIDRPIEQGMTLIHKGRFVTSSSIEAIDHEESVVFNCEIGRNDIAYEPRNRLFKCDRGKWLEDNRRGGSWSLGNNGTFPKCRPAKCECQNGGTCVRDDMCTCSEFSTGTQCETPICPDGCQNGGTCTSPNRCSCPDNYSGNHCQTEEGCQAPIDKGNDAFYRNEATYTVTDESCSGGNVPSFKGQITCEDGHWSEQVLCLKGASYRITVKTADIIWRVGEGTDGEVYLYMYGSKGNSGKIILRGGFEAGDVDMTNALFVDVGKISKIQLGVKARSPTRDGWIPESVLIEDESRRNDYKFVHGAEIDDTSIFLYPLASCYPSTNLRNVSAIYFVGDELRLKPSNCAEGYKPQPSFTKCTEMGWTADVVCLA